jgi:hypothetical protein
VNGYDVSTILVTNKCVNFYVANKHVKACYCRKLNCAEVKEQYQVEITNRFVALENFDDNVDMNRAWENIRENIKISAKESLGHYDLQQHKLWFDDECSKLIDRGKQAKLQWLQNPSQVNGDNMHNVRREASRTFRTKKRGITEKQN